MNKSDAFLDMLIRDYEVQAEKALKELNYVKRMMRLGLTTGQQRTDLRRHLRPEWDWQRRSLCDANEALAIMKGHRDAASTSGDTATG